MPARACHSEQMAHAIEMFFDEHADTAVRALWQQLATAGLPSLATWTHRRHRPHVSLTVTGSLDRADLAGQPVEHWPYYLPGRWVPHCTLAQGLGRDEITEAFRVLHGYQPITAQVTSAGITDTVTGTVTPLTT